MIRETVNPSAKQKWRKKCTLKRYSVRVWIETIKWLGFNFIWTTHKQKSILENYLTKWTLRNSTRLDLCLNSFTYQYNEQMWATWYSVDQIANDQNRFSVRKQIRLIDQTNFEIRLGYLPFVFSIPCPFVGCNLLHI